MPLAPVAGKMPTMHDPHGQIVALDGACIGQVTRHEEAPAGGGWWELGVLIFDPRHWGGGLGTQRAALDPLALDQFDARVGGAWRFVSRGPDGFEMGHGGVIRELVRPERIVTSEPGTTSACTWPATLRPLAICAAARRSSMRPLVQEPMKTRSMAMSVIFVPGFRPI